MLRTTSLPSSRNERRKIGVSHVMRVSSRTTFLAIASSLIALVLPAWAQNATVTVTINGAPVTFDQSPVERAGRVFVPLRGVFEKLGASVVYDRGHINATKGGTTVSLSVGATAALVNGQQQYLDNPPFVVGARVLVPLRFVSQALGTTVNFIRATRTVAITLPSGRAMPRRPLELPATSTVSTGAKAASSTGALTNVVPAQNTAAPPHLAQITAAFTSDVDPNTIHAQLDGHDVTPQIFVTSRRFVYYIVTPLAPGNHTMSISGKSPSGQAVAGNWSFSGS